MTGTTMRAADIQKNSIQIRNKAMHLNQLDTVTAALEAAAAGDHSYIAVQVIAA